ncbi:MAG: endolytic transglycosylase MltG [Armatimonadetes bacterium]|nr:endolytic transglycosylase MltG [Armatimonadota bacterium]MCX7967463.1 endolytic transglycosylase MltG [Armatimonadota bacterium]MDW8143743.1 endolytic transglycosylase MltG [Armatimonadota bacterium]
MSRLKFTALVVFASALVALGSWLCWLLFAPVGARGTVTLFVYRGDNFSRVRDEIERLGLIRSRFWFERLARWRKIPQRLKAGIYRIATPISLWDLTKLLAEEKPELIRLTVWEGMMAKEIAERVEKLGLGNAERFMEIVKNPKDRVELPFEWKGDLEGLLFPATYYVPPLRSNEEAFLIQLMVNAFVEKFWKPYRKEIEQSPFPLRDLVTIASMVQWEVKMDEERPIVAGVIINRLKKGMKLEIDATVLYALGKRKNRVLYRDLRVDSPYNTYRYKGLPPGPICSPGLESLLAALRPEDVPYLYYVARGDGYHIFSSTYDEHLKAVEAYRRWRIQQRRK